MIWDSQAVDAMEEEDLELALEVLTEGDKAVDFSEYGKSVFSEDITTTAIQNLYSRSKPWTLGRGIHGMGIGERIAKGMPTGELALRVYVEKKRPARKVKNRIPRRVRIPEIGVAETDVIEIGRLRLEVFTGRVRPAMPGCGMGHYQTNGGTMGLVVNKKDDGNTYVLSNSHVFADSGLASKGDAIIQHARIDGGRKRSDKIGELQDWVPFVFSREGYPNTVDAAIARVRKNSVNNVIRELGIRPTGVSDVVRREMRVVKVGRTTDTTTGIVKDAHAKINHSVITKSGRRSRVGWARQVGCTEFTGGGDSGSAVLDEGNRVVGLHFLGADGASFFNRIREVFVSLNLAKDLPG